MNYIINTPEGTRDRLFAECTDRRNVQNALTELFSEKGYSEISTPEVEYYDLFIQSGNPLPQESFLKIIDRSGKIMVMRPDCTVPIARVAATKLKAVPLPQRLYYNETVFRSGQVHKGGSSEIAQCGVELIGAAGQEADVEVIALAVQALKAATTHSFHIEVGHVGLFRALAAEMDMGEAQTEQMRLLIEGKHFAALNDLLAPYKDKPAYAVLSRLSQLFGFTEVLDEAEALVGKREEVEYLRNLYAALKAKGCEQYIRFDLGLVHQIDYYTGVVFRGYVEGVGAPVLSGGRYDNLVEKFGRHAPAIGFSVDADAVAACLSQAQVSTEHRLRIALTKGRLQDKSVELFEAMGLDCSPIKNPGRRLVHSVPNYGLDAVLAKAPDVITYVEHGVCDMGIVGKDTILEKGSSFYEVLDLGFGKCRFALAVKEGSDFYGTYKTRRIATKYPEVARSFFEKKGMDVEIIKIEGSVELAPILDLADAIVDIVETGATLRENGLVPIEDVAYVSARLIVNTASMKLYKSEILDFLSRCEVELNKRND